jgi:hypothetical protein
VTLSCLLLLNYAVRRCLFHTYELERDCVQTLSLSNSMKLNTKGHGRSQYNRVGTRSCMRHMTVYGLWAAWCGYNRFGFFRLLPELSRTGHFLTKQNRSSACSCVYEGRYGRIWRVCGHTVNESLSPARFSAFSSLLGGFSPLRPQFDTNR